MTIFTVKQSPTMDPPLLVDEKKHSSLDAATLDRSGPDLDVDVPKGSDDGNAAATSSDELFIDPTVERKLLLKLDLNIAPLLMLVYTIAKSIHYTCIHTNSITTTSCTSSPTSTAPTSATRPLQA